MQPMGIVVRGIGVAFLVVVVAATGCSKTKNKLVPVEGKIAFADGAKLPEGTTLLFNPSEGGTGSAVGVVKADGSFKVNHANGSKGAEIGKYSIALRAPEGKDAEFYRVVSDDYSNGNVLFAEVKEGMSALELTIAKKTK